LHESCCKPRHGCWSTAPFGLLDNDVLEVLIDVFNNELKDTAIIHIGGAGQAHALFTRAAPGQIGRAARRAHAPTKRREATHERRRACV
jgi:hypothetical protein